MAIELNKVGVSAGVGILDLFAEEVDYRAKYNKPFQNITDWGRVVYTGGGYLANRMGYNAELTEAAVLSGIPLIEKSIIDAVRVYTGILPVRPRGRMGLKIIDRDATDKRKPSGGAKIRYV